MSSGMKAKRKQKSINFDVQATASVTQTGHLNSTRLPLQTQSTTAWMVYLLCQLPTATENVTGVTSSQCNFLTVS